MKIERITFQETFPTGNFSNNKLGIEIQLDDTDSPQQAYQTAKQIVNDAFVALNPQIQWNEQEQDQSVAEAQKIINLEHERIEIRIDNAKSIDELGQIKSLLPPECVPAYMKKLKELTAVIK